MSLFDAGLAGHLARDAPPLRAHPRQPARHQASADVGVDACGFRPVRLDEIRARMAEAATWPEELAAAAAAGEIR